MKQIEEEYYKSDEKAAQQPQTSQASQRPIHDLYPLSPDRPVTSLVQDIPEPVTEAVKSIIKSQNTVAVPTFHSSLNL